MSEKPIDSNDVNVSLKGVLENQRAHRQRQKEIDTHEPERVVFDVIRLLEVLHWERDADTLLFAMRVASHALHSVMPELNELGDQARGGMGCTKE